MGVFRVEVLLKPEETVDVLSSPPKWGLHIWNDWRPEMKLSPRNCVECGAAIHHERLAALPDTRTCVNCSRVEKLTDRDVEIDSSAPGELIRTVSDPDRG